MEATMINFETSPTRGCGRCAIARRCAEQAGDGMVAESRWDERAAVQPGKAIFDNFALSSEGLP